MGLQNNYYPKCRKDAQCKCSMCEASLNATRDLRPSVPSNSMFRPIANQLNALGLGFGSPIPPKGKENKWPFFELQKSPHTPVKTPQSEIKSHAVMLEPVFEETVVGACNEKRRCGMLYSRWFWLALVAILVVELLAPLMMSQIFRSALSPEAVRKMVEESRARIRTVDRLDLLQHRIKRVVGGDVSNCTGNSSKWTLTEEGPFIHSSCSLYSSMAEEVSLWGYPIATAGILGRKPMDRLFTVLSGRVVEWQEGQLEYSIHTEGNSWTHHRWSASAIHLDKNTWIIEYRGSSFDKPLGGLSAAAYATKSLFRSLFLNIKWALDSAAFASYSFRTDSPIPTHSLSSPKPLSVESSRRVPYAILSREATHQFHVIKQFRAYAGIGAARERNCFSDSGLSGVGGGLAGGGGGGGSHFELALRRTMAVAKKQLELWLIDTTSPDDAARVSATTALESVEALPGFAGCLLALCAEGQEEGQRAAAATYLKNFFKIHWAEGKKIPQEEQRLVREQLVEVLLRVDSVVLSQLAEAFRIVAANDFSGKENTWQELVPALQNAVQNSDLLSGSANSQFKTLNVLLAIQALTKPFQYFLNPTVAREPVPLLLELISKDLLVPLHGLFRHLVGQALNTKEKGYAQHDNVLLVLTKTFHLAVGSHMPTSLLSCLGSWVEDIVALVNMVVLSEIMDAPEQLSRLKTWKRALQLCCTLVIRHRKQIDKSLTAIANAALKIVGHGTIDKEIHVLQERIISLAFDLLSNILETGPGWRLLAPHFSSLLENAIFPALVMRQKDIVEWNDDEDEYLRKNLPSDLDEACGWRDDLLTPRRSALNLLGLIATSKGPPSAGNANKNAPMKRKKGTKARKDKNNQGTAGELLVMPYLSRYSLHPDDATSESTISYYGALLAYGGLQEFLKAQSSEYLELILSTRVFPLYSMPAPSPYLLANANWLLGELAICLPEAVNGLVYDSLLKAFLAPDAGGVSWRPVRASAAGALSALLEEDYKPAKWFPLLQATISRVKAGRDEATLALQLLSTAAETGEEDVTPHVPFLVASVKEEILKHIPPLPEPWPQVVEFGFSAIAALAQNWDTAEPDVKKNGGDPFRNWKEGCPAMASTFAGLLQRAWIPSAQEQESSEGSPPPSCLSDASVILATIVKYTSDSNEVSKLQIEPLLQVWADLVAEWTAWDEEEDLPVFDVIEEVVALHGRCPLEHFAVAEAPSSPAPPVPPRSLLEGMAAFVSSAMESAYSAATWRACRLSHTLLHSTAFSFEGERVAKLLVCRFTEAAFGRLKALSSFTAPLAKPLILVIATCYVGLPSAVEEVFAMVERNCKDNGMDPEPFLQWAEALSILAKNDADPGLGLETELKLAVVCLLKVIERLLSSNLALDEGQAKLAHQCFESVMDTSIRLKEVQEAEKSEDDEDDEHDEDDDEDDHSQDDSEESDEDDEREETEDEFLERYAETARELEEEAIEDSEGGTEEDGHEIELGVLALADQEKSVFSCIQMHGQILIGRTFPLELVCKFIEKFPQSKSLFPTEYVQNGRS